MEEERYTLTEKGLLRAMEMHQYILDGWTIEQVATYYELETVDVRVMLAVFYHAAESAGIDLVPVPDDLGELDG